MRTAAFAVFVLTAVWCGWFVLIWAAGVWRGIGAVNVLLVPAAVVAVLGIGTGLALLWLSKRSS